MGDVMVDRFDGAKHRLLALWIGLALSLGACDLVSSGALLKGSVTYQERIALEGPVLIDVELARLTSAGAAQGTPLLLHRFEAEGQVPFAFALPLDLARADGGERYGLMARIRVNGEIRFATPDPVPVPIDGSAEPVDLVLTALSGPASEPDAVEGARLAGLETAFGQYVDGDVVGTFFAYHQAGSPVLVRELVGFGEDGHADFLYEFAQGQLVRRTENSFQRVIGGPANTEVYRTTIDLEFDNETLVSGQKSINGATSEVDAAAGYAAREDADRLLDRIDQALVPQGADEDFSSLGYQCVDGTKFGVTFTSGLRAVEVDGIDGAPAQLPALVTQSGMKFGTDALQVHLTGDEALLTRGDSDPVDCTVISGQ
ncbi:MAG: YbaY family lipoprotein [Pseudomonadota bacterium]